MKHSTRLTPAKPSHSTPTVQPPSEAPFDTMLLVSGDFVSTGGMDMGNYSLVDYLARRGLAIHLVAHRVDPKLRAYPNVRFHPIPRPRRLMIAGELALYRDGRKIARQLAAPGLRTLVNGGNCPLRDVNWVHYVHAAFKPLTAGSWLRRAKIHLVHRLYLRAEAATLSGARAIIANSERTKSDLVRHYQLDPALIHTVYYGIDPAAFYPTNAAEKQDARRNLNLPGEQYLFAFVGALGDRRKGFDVLFEAWRAFASRVLGRVGLIVIGTGAELSRWRRKAAAHAAGQSIRFLGFRSDVPAILRACDAFVAPARYEAFGLAALEALCCGLPTIVSRQAGVAELFPPSLTDLLLNDPGSVVELAEKLARVYSRREGWDKIVNPLADTLRNHTWENMSSEIFAIMKR